MTEANPVDPEHVGSEESEPTGPKVTDKRRLDPKTGAVRGKAPAAPDLSDQQAENAVLASDSLGSDSLGSDSSGSDTAGPGSPAPGASGYDASVEGEDVHPDTTLAADLTRDLQRLQAEYVNYKKRVDRDRELHRHVALSSVIEALLPVLDDIHLARQHGDLESGPFAAIADKLEGILTKFGVERFGQPGDAFDPVVHEALMHIQAELAEGTEVTTVVQVLQPGYKMGERVIRAARVAVADPQ
ncbi:MAG TPA: nucleotide exchange factor GrpE [Dermatophilaceae bacterium]